MKKTTAKQRINKIVKQLDDLGYYQVGLVVLEGMLTYVSDVYKNYADEVDESGQRLIISTDVIRKVCAAIDENVSK